MKLLTAVLVLLLASCNGIAASDSSSTVVTTPESSATTTQAASDATGGSSDTTATGGTTQSAGSDSTLIPGTATTNPSGSTDGSNTGSTAAAATTTPAPIKLSTFPVSNNVSPMDAKLILQQAVQLDQQINALNDYLVKAQADTNPTNSPLFAQLTAFSANITSQNNTLQGYITQLQNLAATQSDIDTRLTSATNTFVCFSQSSCVTDVPTTPEPTSPGPTPSVTPCTNKTLKAKLDVVQYSDSISLTNAAECYYTVQASDSTNNVTVMINATLVGSDSYVRLVETRTQNSVTINGTVTNYTFTGFQQIDVYYYSGPRSTVSLSFGYIEVNNCLLDCHSPNGTCRVSQSGVQYCECKPCEFTGDHCETAMSDPCQNKQKRACGATGTTPYGVCYKNTCFDQCYACACSPGGVDPDSEQKCIQPSPSWSAPVAPTGTPVCPSTAAPTTTPALLTSSAAPPAGSSTSNPGGSTGSTASPGSTVTSGDQTTVTGSTGDSSTTVQASSTTGDASTSTVAATSSSSGPSSDGF
ncbi:hypothetical protein CAEBREN_13797 [Caenorhabditis brenneri]|uniref:EGF-like domain-containing protein n=1 Tax=Caenorhabditis brenneri TaxID=135651 RepID=G0P8X5_CAEBE|nr:hypothetical protein CAEBREN_13797 [Caenorhabditis brenneri]